jgi:hypothetical protein
MKNIQSIVGYLATLFLLAAIAFKVNRYYGEEIVTVIAGLLISLYFPVHILCQPKTLNATKSEPTYYALSFSVFMSLVGATLKISHLKLGSLFVLLGLISFCVVYLPLLYIAKSKENDGNKFMYLSGILGLGSFPLGIFLRVYVGSPYGMQLFTFGSILICFFFLPFYLWGQSLSIEERDKRSSKIFHTLIIGFIVFFFMFRSVYPPKTENKSQELSQQINSYH